MSIYVHPIATDRDQLSQYVQFPIDLYRDNSCYVPPLIIDQIATLDPDSNPASDFCESQSFMALTTANLSALSLPLSTAPQTLKQA